MMEKYQPQNVLNDIKEHFIMNKSNCAIHCFKTVMIEKQKKQADNCAEHAVFMAVIISIILSSIGLLFGKEILSLFGAKGKILNLGWEYLHVMCVGMPFMIFSGFFRSILSGEGDMKFPMMVAGLGTILNIILDPIFIFDLESFGRIRFRARNCWCCYGYGY